MDIAPQWWCANETVEDTYVIRCFSRFRNALNHTIRQRFSGRFSTAGTNLASINSHRNPFRGSECFCGEVFFGPKAATSSHSSAGAGPISSCNACEFSSDSSKSSGQAVRSDSACTRRPALPDKNPFSGHITQPRNVGMPSSKTSPYGSAADSSAWRQSATPNSRASRPRAPVLLSELCHHSAKQPLLRTRQPQECTIP
jgi:hypothetical protein